MKFLPHYALVLLLSCIALAGLVAFAADPLLYAIEKDMVVSVYHKNPDALRLLATNSTTDMVPLMQDVIDGQEPVAVDIRLRDFDAIQRDLAVYTVRYAALRSTVFSLDMNGGEIGSFMTSTRNQGDILSDLMNQTKAFDAVKKIAERSENEDDKDVQASVASQAAALKDTIRTLYTRYSDDHVLVMNTSTKLGLDTKLYEETLVEIERLIEEIEAEELTALTLFIEPEQVTYRDSVQIFGVVTPAGGKREVSLLLDSTPMMKISTDQKGNYFAGYTVERIRAGEHTISAVAGALTSEERILSVIKVATVTTLTAGNGLADAETGAIFTGSVMANHPVRNAPLTILFDGNGHLDTTTDDDGTYEVFVSLSPGNHTLRAQFSSDDYPLFPSLSDEVTVEVLPAPVSFSLPDTSSWDPVILYGALALVLLGLGSAAFWFLRRRKRVPPVKTGPYKEPAEAIRIREDLEQIIREAEREFPTAGSEREAALHTSVSSLLGQYWACLMEQGLSEAARQAYLTLAGRIAARLSLPLYRTLTPREMSKTCTTENYAGIFGCFVGVYEKIRYGGSHSEQDRKGFEAELQKADTEVGGDPH